MDPEFVYFDIDDTLLDHQKAERKALADVRARYLALFGALSVDELQDTYHTINAPLWRKYADGEIGKQTVQQQRFERLLEAVDAPHADATLVARYYMQRYAEHWTFIPGARDAFEAVAERHPVGVLTNGFAEVQEKKLDQFPVLREASEAVVICEEVGALKPDPEVFDHATEAAGVSYEDVLYVGDSYQSDVKGAEPVGWRVAWYARNGTDGQATNDRGFIFEDWSTLRERLR
ncbi:MAG: haloacid dehalogenase [Bacteroidetes bacterium QH_1_64_81]|nr:MAG: haloacid dehalogenase [Bacteroidetes bacterium QH_1_64_81]